ncbi:MAG: ribose 5-phosphate isomerase B [Anaerolineales bacterium]|nr:ribose 5-phosphate isomerase B [Anaerolineales bacterium]
MSSISEEEIRSIVQQVLTRLTGETQQGISSVSPSEPSKPDPQIGSQPIDRKVVAIGADHGGFELKELLKADLSTLGYEVIDVGTNSKDAVDYPDFAHEVARLVSVGKAWRGIAIDGAGIGSCIVANKVPGVRAGMAYDYSSAVNSREHNDTNVLTLGAGLIGVNLARQIMTVWLSTAFAGGRHERRVNKIIAIDKLYTKWVHLLEQD